MNFLEALKESFITYLSTSPRSNEKLKVLHGFIASDLQKKLGNEYEVKSLGYKIGKESFIDGRYMSKKVDITIEKSNKPIAGIAVKFVMSNYSQNSNNYFENMLGETANIRSKNIPYFQIFIIPEIIPYYKKTGDISKWENITENNIDKYILMSKDNVDNFYHIPNKTLFAIINFGNFKGEAPKDSLEYKNYFFKNEFNVTYSNLNLKFDNQTIYNDYEEFIEKVYHAILSL
ncbi:hypothetical protein LH651_01000 [Mycoplasma hominis]|uniref:hypothetical protein n=1 Tax=Metamycoplasma hominis TaxID=2098 RepID=UPI0012AADC98|nr:hypothetical protein [Metamycoplasma hominis]MCF1354844.1 hypothetical protein [Metamycoplasma hominis]